MARLIRIEKPESGLDVFLKEVSAYLSPQYQLAKRQEERADARLELSKRQMAENERRYQDSLTQQRFQNNISSQNAEINKERFELNKSNSAFEIAKQYINESFSGMNAQERAGMNIDSLLIDVSDSRAKSRARQYAENIQKSGKRELQTILSRMNLYNQGRDESGQISKAEALDLFGDDKLYNDFLVTSYLKEGKLTEEQKYLINSNTTRLTSLRKQQSDLLTQQASGVAGSDDALAEVTFNINQLQKEIDSIVKRPSITQGSDSNIDAYSNQGASATTTELPDFLIPDYNPGEVTSAFTGDDMYNVLFADSESIADNAVDMANRNVSEEDVKDVVIDNTKEPANELDEGVTEKDIRDMLTKAKEQGKDEEVDFLESALSGLGSLGAEEKEEPNIKPVESELFPEVKKEGVFTKDIPGKDKGIFSDDRKLRNPSLGSRLLRKKISKLKRDIKISDTAPNLTTRENFKKTIPDSIEELKRLFSLIYDESTDTFYNPKNPSQGTYEKRLSEEDINFIKGL